MHLKKFIKFLFIPLFFIPACLQREKADQGSDRVDRDYISFQLVLPGNKPEKITLYRYYGKELIPADTSRAGSGDTFGYELPESIPAGVYRLVSNPNSLDLILNRENVLMRTRYGAMTDSLVIVESIENQIYYDYLRKRRSIDKKLELLQPLIRDYPREDPFHDQIRDQYRRLMEEEQQAYGAIKQKHPGSYALKYITALRTPLVNPHLDSKERTIFLKENLLPDVPFHDSTLLNSPAFPRKAIEYLSLYRDPRTNQQEQIDAFKKGIDELLSRCLENDEVYRYMINFLMEGFDRFREEEILRYIVNDYLPLVSCTDQRFVQSQEERLAKYDLPEAGMPAPEFSLPDSSGEKYSLDQFRGNPLLLIFWASWCPHCQNALQILKRELPSSFPYRIIGIAIDRDPGDWKAYLEQHDLPWVNLIQQQGWDGEMVQNYGIYAVPGYILIDGSGNIKDRLNAVEELKRLYL